MKRSILFLCLAATSALAAVTLVPGTSEGSGWQLVRGTTLVGSPHATEAACVAAVRLDAQARNASAQYRCVNTVAVRADWTPDPVALTVVAPGNSGDAHNGGLHAGNMPRYNVATIPEPARGSSTYDVQAGNAQPYPEDIGAFRTRCTVSHFNRDDSLVYPGQVGRAHLHMYFGNTGSDANSTPESLRTTGNSTCRGGIANRSTYWVPAIIDTTDGTVINMAYADVYYKTGYLGVRNEDVKPIPSGLRMIAGNMTNTARPREIGSYAFRCGGKREPTVPTGCTSGELEVNIIFPQCWDGRNLSSPDQKSHMRYARRGCPSSHPVALPEIAYVMYFSIPQGRDTSNWRLSSDNYAGGQGGNSMHADWINGWDPELPPIWTTQIINRGMSGGSHMLGDGRTMY